MTRFPKIPMERTCRLEQSMRNDARYSYKKRLEDEREAARGLLDEGGEVASGA
jgi:hypothetical protein